MKAVFCGSRGWVDERAIYMALTTFPHGTMIITGGAKGADRIAHALASEQLRFTTKVMRADWEKHGRVAGYVRNEAMLDEGPDVVWAFWDGHSKGTQHTITEAMRRKIDLHIVFQKGHDL